MSYVLIFLLTVLTGLCRANDTLTRAQAYNFSIGDSFDYKNSGISLIGTPLEYYSESFEREVIVDTYYSANSDTLFIVKKLVSAYYGTYYPTDVITNLQDYEIYYANEYGCFDTTFTTDSTSQYNGRKINESVCSGGLESVYEENRIVEGLGIVRKYQSSGNPFDGFSNGTRELMYYSKGTETWGTPLPVGINMNDVQQRYNVSLYPTVNSGTFNISVNLTPVKTEFKLIDIYGRTVFTTEMQNQLSSISIKDFVPGLFVWTVTQQNKIIETGKLILE